MPWSGGPVDDKTRMVQMWLRGSHTKTELAPLFKVTRRSVQKWIKRFEEGGWEALEEKSRAPHNVPNQTPSDVVDQLLRLKADHPLDGPAKLVVMMEDREGNRPMAVSTAGEHLKKHGMVRPRKRRRSNGTPTEAPRFEIPRSGHTMTADHKGKFRMGNGQWCYPLTVADPVSRFIYTIQASPSTAVSEAIAVFTRLFKEYGVPDQIITDNGVPFCCPGALGGLSQLSKWWIRLGIHHGRIEPGQPQQNGRHERMHRTLADRIAATPQNSFRSQQTFFNSFRYEFNYLRPHEALGQVPPSTVMAPCERSFPSALPELEYPSWFELRRVRSNGQIKWDSQLVFVSEVLIGEIVGLDPVDDGLWDLYFGSVRLGRLDERKMKIR